MKEFDYDLPYKELDFTDEETRKLYRIGRGEQGVLLFAYTNDICVIELRLRDCSRVCQSYLRNVSDYKMRKIYWYGYRIFRDGFYQIKTLC